VKTLSRLSPYTGTQPDIINICKLSQFVDDSYYVNVVMDKTKYCKARLLPEYTTTTNPLLPEVDEVVENKFKEVTELGLMAFMFFGRYTHWQVLSYDFVHFLFVNVLAVVSAFLFGNGGETV
jgi:hypothetical protein